MTCECGHPASQHLETRGACLARHCYCLRLIAPRPPVTPAIRYLYARDIATMFGVQLGTVHSWAARDDWRRTRAKGGRTRYHPDDVQATYDRLNPPRKATP